MELLPRVWCLPFWTRRTRKLLIFTARRCAERGSVQYTRSVGSLAYLTLHACQCVQKA